MCERYDRNPGAVSVAPRRLQLVLVSIGSPYVLPENWKKVAEHFHDMVRTAYDTLCVKDGVWKPGDDFSHVKLEHQGPEYIDYVTAAFVEIHDLDLVSGSPRREALREIMNLSAKLAQRLPLTDTEWQTLNTFLVALRTVFANLTARCM